MNASHDKVRALGRTGVVGVYTRGTDWVGGGPKLQANPGHPEEEKEREMLNRKMKPIAAAVGAAFATSFAANAIADEANPFEASLLEDAVILATSHKEGGCGEDKDKKDKGDDEGKCGEGKCGEGKEDGDSEGKCGEGKCGEEGESEEESEEE